MYLILAFVQISGVLGALLLYPTPGNIPASDKFRVFIQQDQQQKQESFTYISKSDHRRADSSKVRRGRSVSWTSFSFTGSPVTLEVHTPRNFRRCIVRPKSYGYRCRRTGTRTARVVVNSNRKQMSIEFDNDYGSYNREIRNKLLVFVDPPERDVPNPHDNGVLYYRPGVHNLAGVKALDATITKVYLSPGAFIKGGFRTTAGHSVKIYGRGVVSTETYRWRDKRLGFAVINMDAGSDHVVEGITISDPFLYYIRASGNGNTVRNVKTVASWTPNSDGVVTGRNGTVENSFFMANDDAIKTGWWRKRIMHHVKVSDVDVIHTDWCTFKGRNCRLSENNAVLGHRNKDTIEISMSDIELNNIRVEGTCPRILNFQVRSDAVGSIFDVRLKDWTIESQKTNDLLHNALAGSTNCRIHNWHFTNFKIGNRCVHNAGNFDLKINRRTTRNVQFNCAN